MVGTTEPAVLERPLLEGLLGETLEVAPRKFMPELLEKKYEIDGNPFRGIFIEPHLFQDTGEQIVIRNGNFWYGKEQALRDVDVSIPLEEGVVTAIMGPSGCGKSTLLRTLNRIYVMNPGARFTGRYDYRGMNAMKADPVSLRRYVGMVFQRPNPFPKSIFDNVAYGPRVHGLKNKAKLNGIVQEALEKAYLWDEVKDRLKDSAFSLSGGQQQRLCIARSLAVGVDAMLMDEPCSALDPKATDAIEYLIEQLEVPVVIVTHNLQQASRVSQNVLVMMAGGVLAEAGYTQNVFSNPQHPLVCEYLCGRFG
jgi:phosphate transport system ATP-binding protein